jgi:hypothetical protein
MPTEAKALHLLAGGRSMDRRRGPDPLLAAVFSQPGLSPAGTDGPKVGYLGVASNDNAVFRAWAERMFRAAGAGAILPARLCGRRPDRAAAVAALEAADIIYMSGGDVEFGMRVLAEHDLVGFLRGLHAAGKPFFGLSAGSIMLARGWVRWRDPQDESSAELFDCLGLAPVWCDTHGEADGWEELHALVRMTPAGSIGHGITSGAALRIGPDGTPAAMGGPIGRFEMRAGAVVELSELRPADAPD